MKRLLLLTAAVLVTSCSPAEPKKAQTVYDTSLPMLEVMGHVIDPAAFLVWRSSGEVITKDGVQSLVPTTDEGWTQAENGALTLIAASNVLKLPGYARDDGDWMKFATQMAETAKQAQIAAETKDGEKMFVAGGKIYEVCTACHEKYYLPEAEAQEDAREAIEAAKAKAAAK